MTTNNKPAYLVIDFDVASLDKVESFKSALAIALLHDNSEFVPEEENDTIYSTKKEGFYRVIAKDGDVKDEILEELINGTLIVPQRILDRALDVEATFLDESLNVNPLIVTYPQQTEESHEDEQIDDTEVQDDQEQDNQHSTYHLVKELLPDTEQLLDKLSEPLEVEPAALTSPNVVLLKSQLDTSLNQMQLLVDDQLSAAIRSGALQSSVQDVSKRLVDSPPSEILDYQLALEKQVKYREELNDQVDLIKGSYNEGLESYIESKIPELRAEYLATHPDDTDVRVAEFLAEHAHELVSVEEGVVNTREKAEAKVLHSVIENASASELRKIMKLLKAKELYQRTLDDVVKAWHATQGRKEDVQSTIIEPQHFEAPAVETQQETEKETVQDDVKHDDVDLSFLEDSSLDDIEAQLHQRIETSAQQERDAHEQALHTNVEQEKAQEDTFDHLEDENVDLEEAEETHTTVVPAPVTVPKIDYSAITASDDDEDVDLEDADESEDTEDVLDVNKEEPVQQAVQLDTHIGTVANEVESNDDDEIIEDSQPSGDIDVDSMFEELNTGEATEEATKPVKQSLSKKTKLIAGGVTAGIVLLTAGGIYASQHLFNSPSQETTQQESTAATQQESETTIATTIVSVGDTLRVSVGGKEMNVKVIEVKSDGSATVETPDGEKLAIPYESLKTLLEK